MDTKTVQSNQSTQQSITIRIVFDGAPYAGKTTAAYSLSEALGEVAVTPAEEPDGRTAWFDWVTYTGGRHEGKSIRVELVTVPGQDHLNDRRRHLLQWADVVVFVADTEASALDASAAKFDELRRDLQELGELPIVVIANKRDVADVVPVADVRQRLDLHDEEALIEGIATTGGGIRQAFIFAVRAALGQAPDRVEQTSAEDLLQEMEAALFSQPPAAGSAMAPPDSGVASDSAAVPTEPTTGESTESPDDSATPSDSAAVPTEPTTGESTESPDDSATPSDPAAVPTEPTTGESTESPDDSPTPSDPAVVLADAASEPDATASHAAAETPTGPAANDSRASAAAATVKLKSGAVPEGTSVVLYPIHWDVLAAIANGLSDLPTSRNSPEVQATRELLEWGLIVVDSHPVAEHQAAADSHPVAEHQAAADSNPVAEHQAAAEQSATEPAPSQPTATDDVATAPDTTAADESALTTKRRDGSAARQARADALAAESGSTNAVANATAPIAAPATAVAAARSGGKTATKIPDEIIHPYATAPASAGHAVENRNDRYKALRELRRSLRA